MPQRNDIKTSICLQRQHCKSSVFLTRFHDMSVRDNIDPFLYETTSEPCRSYITICFPVEGLHSLDTRLRRAALPQIGPSLCHP